MQYWIQGLILRLSKIKLIAASNFIIAKEHLIENYDRKVKPFLGNEGNQDYVKKGTKTYRKPDNK